MSAPVAQPDDFALLILDIRETHRVRQDLLRMEKAANNQIEAAFRGITGLTQIERARMRKKASNGEGHGSEVTLDQSADPEDDPANGGGRCAPDIHREDAPADLAAFLVAEEYARRRCAPLYAGRNYYADARKPYEKRLERLAKELPVWPWVEGVRGFGALGLAQIVAECGDLHNYANPAKVWKRMGLAVMPDGTRQRRVSGEEAIAHGYSPQRRSIMYVIGDSLIKGNRDGEYRTIYLARKEHERAKLPDAPAAHIDNRARRYLEKRLLKHLWQVWHGRIPSDVHPGFPQNDVPDSGTTDAEDDGDLGLAAAD